MDVDNEGGVSPEAAQASVTRLEQGLWKTLADQDAGEGSRFSAWLELLAGRVGGVRTGALFDARGPSLQALAEYPQGAVPPTLLAVEARRALESGSGVATTLEGEGEIAICAFPVMHEGDARWVVVLAIEAADPERIRNTLREIQWAEAYLQEQSWAESALESERALGRLRMATEALVAALDRTRFSEAAMTTVTELARRFDCDRVAIGFARRRGQKVAAISHAARFAERMQIVQLVRAAMEEASDQRSALIYPATDEGLAVRAHEALARKLGSVHVLTIPMMTGDRITGAITLERSGAPFTQESVEALQTIASMIGPVLVEKRLNDRWVIWKVFESLGRQARFTLGPTHFGRKVAILAVAGIAGFFWWATAPYKVVADAVIEGAVRRAMVAPFDGFIFQSGARAGDSVVKGDVLARLDDADLTLERLRWVTERQQRELAYEDALSQRQRADAALARIGVEQAEARIALIDAELERTVIRAPFDGLVISGDLSQSVGTAIARGDLMFEIAPLDWYRVVLEVDETQIAEVVASQTGELVVASLSGEPFTLSIDKITPVARVVDGRNVFEVDATVEGDVSRLRPGMEGIAKIDVEERRLIAIWTRTLVDWIRMMHWRWFG